MRSLGVVVCSCTFALVAFGQGDRGSITGTVTDPAGAVIANASIQVRNAETAAVYEAASSTTGNYTLAQLPTGTYEISANVPGFKNYVRRGIVVEVAQILRIDISLEVGASSEFVTVTADASLLKTESGELSHNVSSDRLDNLPILGIGATQAGSSGIRNPMAASQLIPGTTFQANVNIRVNGAPSNTQAIRIEGQDATNGGSAFATGQIQPSVEAIQEVSIQTSNYAAEYGQVGGGLFNFTVKSGTNQFHGTAYDYFVNEVLNAGQAFTNNGSGSLVRPVQRRNDYGFTLGGPVDIPKLYNGHDRTFFFFNWEQYRETIIYNNMPLTIPTLAYRTGDFSQLLALGGNKVLATDPLGRPIVQGTIYDPSTERTVNGLVVRDPFPGNIIPASSFDPVALKIQALIPQPTSSGVVNNYLPIWPSQRVTYIPAVKIDQLLGPKAKLSFYWSLTRTDSDYAPTSGLAEGLPQPITQAVATHIHAQLESLNFDYTLTPTLLLHLGAGYQGKLSNGATNVLGYNSLQQLGLEGATVIRSFPRFTGLTAALGGGMNSMGPLDQNVSNAVKPSGNATLTWVRNNHSYKGGAEFRAEGYLNTSYTDTGGAFNFSGVETGLPSTLGQNLQGGQIGFSYASFLLGAADSGDISPVSNMRFGKSQLGIFIQDSWKVTRRFTLDYGLRYDYSTYLKEQYGRYPSFSLTTPNPSAGSLPGATIYEGSGPGRCNCQFAHNYPYAIGPRLGGAFQVTPKTVIRAGWGLVYDGTNNFNQLITIASPAPNPFSSPSYGEPATYLRTGVPLPPSQIIWPNFNPGQYPSNGVIGALPISQIDPNAGRPPRQNQWSVGVQREIFRNLAVEATYVGNRGVWWQANNLVNYNAISQQKLAAFGLNLSNPTDVQLLSSTLNSPLAAALGFNRVPYAGFPMTLTVAQSLRPFPQFTTISNLWAPLGKTWYDSLQMKATKRFSRGLEFTSVFVWQKEETLGAEQDSSGAPGSLVSAAASINDTFNRGQNKYLSGFEQPFTFNNGISYTLPALKLSNGFAGKATSWLIRNWSIGALLIYSSGLPIKSPASNNNLSTDVFQTTYANRVPGAPLFTEDLNCHCFDPNKTFVLNPAAWTDPPAGQFGTSAAYYNDYRYQRRPAESMSLGRAFRIKERASIYLRMEFTNAFNRTEMNNPTATNAEATQARSASGQPTAGFGYINTGTVAYPPRQGMIVGRFQF